MGMRRKPRKGPRKDGKPAEIIPFPNRGEKKVWPHQTPEGRRLAFEAEMVGGALKRLHGKNRGLYDSLRQNTEALQSFRRLVLNGIPPERAARAALEMNGQE